MSVAAGRWRSSRRRRRARRCSPRPRRGSPASGSTDVARQAGLDFRQDDFRFGIDERRPLDDGRRPLLARLQQRRQARPLRRQLLLRRRLAAMERNAAGCRGARSSRTSATAGSWTSAPGRTPTRPSRGTAASPADFNGDGYTDLFVTTNTYNVLLWNNGDGTFTDGTHAAGIDVVRHLRLAHRRGRRGRQRRRAAGHLRLRVRRRERPLGRRPVDSR